MATAALQGTLSTAQVEYLSAHREPFEYQGHRPTLDDVFKVLEKRRSTGAAPSPVSSSSPSGGIVLDVHTLEEAPLRLDGVAALRLSSEQAQAFFDAFTQARGGQRVEATLVEAIRRTVRPAQMARAEQLARQNEGVRRVMPLDLLIATLSTPSVEGR
ncbi:MAG: hypothetical protein EB084_14560 [Proteobacteria bacterium]|nr:hypothetical protein [Pseudomonadota bacterium]